jgi:hypothetical protein
MTGYKKTSVKGYAFEYKVEDLQVRIRSPKLNISQIVSCDIITGMGWAEIDYAIYKRRFKMTKGQIDSYITNNILALPRGQW